MSIAVETVLEHEDPLVVGTGKGGYLCMAPISGTYFGRVGGFAKIGIPGITFGEPRSWVVRCAPPYLSLLRLHRSQISQEFAVIYVMIDTHQKHEPADKQIKQ